MTKPLRQQLPYHPDSALRFAAIREMPWAVFLDSGRPFIRQGRYDILAADPVATLVTRGADTRIKQQDERLSKDDPLALLRSLLQPECEGFPDLPFCGGAIGYFGYDLGRRLEGLPAPPTDPERLPDMAVGLYDWALVVDHQRRQSWLVGQESARARWGDLVERLGHPPGPADGMEERAPFQVQGAVRSPMEKRQYAAAFDRIQRYIHAGDCYQVNLSQPFSVAAKGDSWVAYRALRRSNPAPFSAYLEMPFAQILSCSPELFLQVRGNRVETRPIKGTAPRGRDRKEDERLARQLLHSDKNRAENLMIVDLLRNDLGKGCGFGTVRVPELFKIESFATVHHLVSTVTGIMAPGTDSIALLRDCFPGGSITGAPKRRAMEIIDELEPHRREVYCGAIGYIGFDGDMQTSIAIRTLAAAGGEIRFWAGGGIVADSVMEEEYREIRYKAAAMFALLGHPGPDRGR